MQFSNVVAAVMMAGAALVSEPPLACNMGALTHAERTEQVKLCKKLVSATTARREVDGGYVFDVAPERMSIAEVGRWIGYETRCCPFLEFRMEVGRDGKHVSLQLTGRQGVKEFLQEEIPQPR